MTAHQPMVKASAAVCELVDVRGGCRAPAHTSLGYSIIVTAERYKLRARPASTMAILTREVATSERDNE